MQIWSNHSYIFSNSFDGYRKSHCRKLILGYSGTSLHPVSGRYPYSWLPATIVLLPFVPLGSCYQKLCKYSYSISTFYISFYCHFSQKPEQPNQLLKLWKPITMPYPKTKLNSNRMYEHLPRVLENKIILLRATRLKLWYPPPYSKFLWL